MIKESQRIITKAQQKAAKWKRYERMDELRDKGYEIKTVKFKTKWTPREIEAVSARVGRICDIPTEDRTALKGKLSGGALIFTKMEEVELAADQNVLTDWLKWSMRSIIGNQNETVGVTFEENEKARKVSYPASNPEEAAKIQLLRFGRKG